MHNKHKLFTLMVAFATAFSFLAVTMPNNVNAAAEEVALGEGYSTYSPAIERAASHADKTNPQKTASKLYEAENPPLLGKTYGHSDLIEITNADFFDTPMVVKYPKGFTAKVEVDHPEYVDEIQWVLSDGYDLVEIPGINQGGYEFFIPSTNPYDKNFYICAVITDKNGDRLITEDLAVTVDDSDMIPVLYVVEYALTAGESIDLADVNYGTGTIAFDANGTDFTFTDVQMEVDESAKYMYKDLSMGMGVFLHYNVYDPEYYTPDLPTNYNFNLIGDTSIINNLYEERTYSALGVEFNAYFHTIDNLVNRPTITLKSDGALTLHGGARAINTDSNLVLNLDLDITPVNSGAYTTAIYTAGLTVSPNHTIDVASNGGIIESNGDVIFGDDTTIIAKSTPTQAHNEFLGFAGIFAAGNLEMSNAKLDFTGEVAAEKFIDNYLVRFPVLISNQDMEIKDSDVNIDVKYNGESPLGDDFASNLTGLRVTKEDCTLAVDNSNVSVKLDAPEVINAAGISSFGAVDITDSAVDIDVSGRGQVLGISSQELLTINDSNINSNVVAESAADIVNDEFAGIAGRPVIVNLSDSTYKIHSKINQGAAFVSATKKTLPDGADLPVYNADYVPSLTKLNGAEILLPEDGVLSSYTYSSYTDNEYRFAETPYSLSDTSAPALEVTIAVPSVIPKVPDTGRR